MRVNRESLIRIAKETAQERAFNNRDIVAAYLTGSLVSENDPMLGGAADGVSVPSARPAGHRAWRLHLGFPQGRVHRQCRHRTVTGQIERLQ